MTRTRILVVDDQYASSEPHRASFIRAVAPPDGAPALDFIFDPGPTTFESVEIEGFLERLSALWGTPEREVTLALVLLDVHFANEPDLGFRLLDRIRADARFGDTLPVVMLTSEDSAKRQRASRAGADGFLPKSHDQTLEPLLSYPELRKRVLACGLIEDERQGTSKIVGRSLATLRMLREARQYALGPRGSRLLYGETGTGKNELGAYIHYASGRSGPYVKWVPNPANDDLLASSLMGHWRGAFTGADISAAGQIELAHGGTFLLDEVGYLTPKAQDLLIGFRRREGADQLRRISRLGAFSNVLVARTRTGSTSRAEISSDRFRTEHQVRGELDASTGEIGVDVLFFCATNLDLRDDAERSRRSIREDLYVEFGAPLLIPSLNDRRSDVPLIAQHVISLLTSNRPRPVELDPSILDVLAEKDWTQKNIPELRKVLESALVKLGFDFDHLTASHLPDWFSTTPSVPDKTIEPVARAFDAAPPALVARRTTDDLAMELAHIEVAFLRSRVQLLRCVLEETRKPGPRGPGAFQAERAISRLLGYELDGTQARRAVAKYLVSDLEMLPERRGLLESAGIEALLAEIAADPVLDALAQWASGKIKFAELNRQLASQTKGA